MSQDLTKTIAESFELFQSEFETQYDYVGKWVEQEETPQATEDDDKVIGEPPTKTKRDTKTTSLEEAVTKLNI